MNKETPISSAIDQLVRFLQNLEIKFLLIVEIEYDLEVITTTLKRSDVKDRVKPLASILCKVYVFQRTLTYFVRGNITVWLTSCLTGLDSAVWLN